MRISCKTAFFLSLLSLIFIPKTHLFFFAPTLIITLYRKPLFTTLWAAVVCGLVYDLFTSTTILGVTSLNYALTISLLATQKKYFFSDNPTTLPLMTFAFSVASTLWMGSLSLFSLCPFFFSWSWVFTDLILMSLADALYALLLFFLPFQLYAKMNRVKS